ncbi:hypothetical protein C8A05DRAFT_12118 [Staphylotrichum tortipilum]|uniref:Ankyrin repeat protein n=1 Tax=Staphylotrichum tortipilum TaxID=2831512 RepID=A0AAN6RXU1_9PEZI|nr:hypothetical protein C8A05DRAFT_12118 [Staphylotrichum longicolle]
MEDPPDPQPYHTHTPPSFTRQSSSANKINPVAHDPEHAPPTCRSELPHGPEAIRDHVKHYFACIEISKRPAFFNPDDPIWAYELEREVKAVHALMPNVPETDESVQSKARERVKAMKGSLAVAIENEYERTKLLRKALMAAPDPPTRQNTGSHSTTEVPATTHGHLVKCLENSCCEWKASTKYQNGMELVRNWKRGRNGVSEFPPQEPANVSPEPSVDPLDGELKRIREVIAECIGRAPPAHQNVPDYDVERDVNAYLIQYTRNTEFSMSFSGPTVPGQRGSTSHSHSRHYLMPTDEKLTDNRFEGHFPGQRLSIGALLNSTEHPAGSVLSRSHCSDTDPSRIRYFHLPSNNMQCRQKAIAAYYDEERPDLRNTYREPPVKTRSHMLLRPQFWRGQQNGARSGVVHARHMRPLCERVSSEVDEIEDNPKNLVLFMPYLHWETDRMRSRMANSIDAESEKQRRRWELKSAEKSRDRKLQRKDLPSGAVPVVHPESSTETIIPDTPHDPYGTNFDRNRRLCVNNPLGQYLIDAARLYEAMSTYRDQQMFEKYLYSDPPLHPRRTLDQSYYWTLQSTRDRDRDQVVYRETSMDPNSHHHLKPVGKKPAKKTAASKLPNILPVSKPASEDEPQWRWDRHCSQTDEKGCEDCRENIRKVSEVVMVDQLWMWILDEQTVITSFPKRYGFNKSDSSGVHKSIRSRLRNARKNQFRSVYDIALVILDECSNTFFDRAKPADSQPQVLSIFSDAIGNVNYDQTVSSQRFWNWASDASGAYHSKFKDPESVHMHRALLDIHTEGRLQRQIKDIIDELDMMLHVYKKQREVMRRFCRNVEQILDPEGRWKQGAMRDMDHHDQLDKQQAAELAELAEKREQLFWFRSRSEELLSDVDDRIEELDGLRRGAETTSRSINDILTLKQQQASVVQAWESVKQGDETVSQGRSIMFFTVFTILFLPLSFMTSVFGMNNKQFDGEKMMLGDELKYISLMITVTISVGVSLLALFIALSSPVQAGCGALVKMPVNWVLTKTGLYHFWLAKGLSFRAKQLRWDTETNVYKMRKAVKDVRLNEVMEKWRENDKREKEKRREEKKRGKEGGTCGGGSTQQGVVLQRASGSQGGASPAQGGSGPGDGSRVKQQPQGGRKGVIQRLWASVTGSTGITEISATNTDDDLGKAAYQNV